MENIEQKIETEQREKDNYERFFRIIWLFSELLLFAGVALQATQPLIVLCGKAFFLPFTVYGVFFTSSVLSLVAVFVRISLFLCLKIIKQSFKNLKKQDIKDFFWGKWEIVLLFFALVWTYISCLVAKNQAIVWSGNGYNVEGFWAVLKYGVIFLDAYLINSKTLKKLFCNLLVVSAGLMGIMLLYTNISGMEFYFHFTRSVYRNSNHYGYALALSSVMAVGLSLHEKKIPLKAVYLFFFAVLHANMLVSDCFGSLLGEICGIVAVFALSVMRKKSKEFLWLAITVAVIFACTTFVLEKCQITSIMQDFTTVTGDAESIIQGEASGKEGTKRWYLWTETIELIKKVPFFGKGLDCYYGNDYVNGTLDMPHNEFLQIASNVGIPALLLYLGALGGIYVRAILRRRELSDQSIVCLSAGVGYLVSAFFGNTFTYTYPFLLIVLAFGMIKQRRK